MSTYTLTLTPALKNFATEGGLDTALVAGKSIQRTGFIPVQDGSSPPNRKVVVVADKYKYTEALHGLFKARYRY